MKLIDLICEISTQTFSLFRERRCVLCHIPFHPREHSQLSQEYSQYMTQNNMQKDLQDIERENMQDVEQDMTQNILSASSKNQYTLIVEYIQKLATQHIQSNLCPECAAEIKVKEKGFCPLCGELFADKHMAPTLCANCARTKPAWNSFLFFGTYESSIREILLKAKFKNSNSSLYFLGKLLAYFWVISLHTQSLHNNTHIKYPSHIIPMPLHNRRLKERGYNQCIELTKIFVKELDILFAKLQDSKLQYSELQYSKPKLTVDYSNLMRTNFRQAQSELNSKERILKVKNAFAAKNMQDRHILLIDDIATTNSTLKEASYALHKAGAAKVDILILAKASIFSHK